MDNAHEYDRLLNEETNHPDEVINFQRLDDCDQESALRTRSGNGRLFHFFAELRRRRVCRAAAMYAIAYWLICQIVATVAPELDLPTWTLKFVILLGLVGFPIALTISWLVDITPEGVVVDHEQEAVAPTVAEIPPRRLFDHVMDCSLVLAALVIGVQLATGLLSTAGNATEAELPKISVLPLSVAAGDGAGEFAEGLLAQIQHELVSQSGAIVIAPRKIKTSPDCFSLTGVIAINEQQVKVTATITDNKIGVVTWSQVFTRTLDDSLDTQVEMARDIVTSLPMPFSVSSTSESASGDSHAI